MRHSLGWVHIRDPALALSALREFIDGDILYLVDVFESLLMLSRKRRRRGKGKRHKRPHYHGKGPRKEK